jgi:hypothetical protein
MDSEIEALLGRLREVEEEVERTLEARRAEFRYSLERRKVVFERGVIARHRQIRIGVIRFLRESSLGALLISPAIYVLIVPFALLDLAVALYQSVCFPVWGMARVRRADYIAMDRHRLAYLNGIEKLNCVYCGYANGLIALVREVAIRTEQYWCPIRHALRVKGAHPRQRRFAEYGAAEEFRDRLETLRDEVRKL